MLRLIFGLHLNVGSSHAIFPDFFGGKLPPRDLEATQFGAEVFHVAAGIDQRAERHVTANARETIEISEFHGSSPPQEQPTPTQFRWRRIHSIGGE